MDGLQNIFDEDTLRSNVEFAALFVLNYECLKQFVIDQLIGFYSDSIKFEGEKVVYERSDLYKKEVRGLDKKADIASMKWFLKAGAITEQELEVYNKCKSRRDDITHEFLKNLYSGFSKDDVALFETMIRLYQKIDRWWINEIEIPIAADEVPADYDKEQVFGGQAFVLSAINDIMLGNAVDQYNEVLELLRKMQKGKNHGQKRN